MLAEPAQQGILEPFFGHRDEQVPLIQCVVDDHRIDDSQVIGGDDESAALRHVFLAGHLDPGQGVQEHPDDKADEIAHAGILQ